MKKIPTIFERDWNGDKSRVLDKINPEAQWVFDGEGVPTRKIDGTSVKIEDNFLYKRRELGPNDTVPKDFKIESTDLKTGKKVGWVYVGDGPEDRWHREAFKASDGIWPDGTYELVGPKVQGNPEGYESHTLVPHTSEALSIGSSVPRTFDGLKNFIATVGWEGIVFHHPDGRMAKIKGKDFGLKR